MLKKVIKIATFIVFFAFIIGLALIYFEEDVDVVRRFSVISLYIAVIIASMFSIAVFSKWIRNKKDFSVDELDRTMSLYWKSNIKKIRQSQLSMLGNPFSKYPSFLLLSSGNSTVDDVGVPAMGGDYNANMPNILIGNSIFIVEFPLGIFKKGAHLFKKIGRRNIRGVLIEEENLNLFSNSDYSNAIFSIIQASA